VWIESGAVVKFAYADPPYPGQSAKHYADHPDFAGEVDHQLLIEHLCSTYDGWLLHTSSSTLQQVLALCPPGLRIFAWVKPFAAFKRNVSPAYAWEPVIVNPLRKAEPNQTPDSPTMRDWFSEPITLKRGLTGAKPERLCHWLFEACGLCPDDELDDLFPGSGAVMGAWDSWCAQPRLGAAA
jgi:hypothetical protein